MALSRERGIPQEIVNFLQASGGHSLIVKGPAGTGKTTLALQLTEELGEVQSSYYMSLRVSDESLYRQFPWLREKVKDAHVVRVGRHFLRTVQTDTVQQEPSGQALLEVNAKAARQLLRSLGRDEGVPQKVDRAELLKLEGRIEMGEEGEDVETHLGEGEVRQQSVVFDLGSDLPEVDQAYDAVEMNLPGKTLVLIDSIDALAERYGIAPSKLVNTLQKDLVENSGANVLYVLESSGETRLDYLGDGVIGLSSEEHAGRRVRMMTVEKLRGTEVQQHKYLYTLTQGRLRAFPVYQPTVATTPRPWAPVPDLAGDLVSTGHPALDGLIGGFHRGAIVALEVGLNVPGAITDHLKSGFIANSVAHERGVAYVPSQKANADVVRAALSPHTGAEAFDDFVRVFETSPLGSLEASKNALLMEGSNVETDLKWTTVEYHLPKAKHPFLALMAFDTLETIYGDKVFEHLTAVLMSIRRAKDVFVGVTSPLSKSYRDLTNLAHVHLKVENLDGSIVVYGEKPYTQLYGLEFDTTGGFPRAVLTPIV